MQWDMVVYLDMPLAMCVDSWPPVAGLEGPIFRNMQMCSVLSFVFIHTGRWFV